MPKWFEKDGLRFQYPENWQVETEENAEGWTVNVVSPATAFLMLSYQPGLIDPTPLMDEALAVLQKEYKDCESEEVSDTIAKSPATGLDVNFISLDLTNTCWLRGLALAGGSLFIMSQCTDGELNLNGRVMKAMIASLEIED